jgi:DtxR family Mn-dependent transcriptional regulator
VRRVQAEDADRLRYLALVGLVPGAQVTVIDHQPFSGPVTVMVGAETKVIGREIGDLVLCQQAGAR